MTTIRPDKEKVAFGNFRFSLDDVLFIGEHLPDDGSSIQNVVILRDAPDHLIQLDDDEMLSALRAYDDYYSPHEIKEPEVVMRKTYMTAKYGEVVIQHERDLEGREEYHFEDPPGYYYRSDAEPGRIVLFDPEGNELGRFRPDAQAHEVYAAVMKHWHDETEARGGVG